MIEIYIAYLLQTLSFSGRFRQFEMKNFLRRQYFLIGSPSRTFFISTGLYWGYYKLPVLSYSEDGTYQLRGFKGCVTLYGVLENY